MLVAQSYSTLCDPMDCTLPGPSVLGILQARVLEWIAISFSRERGGCMIVNVQPGACLLPQGHSVCCICLVAQSCPTLFDPMDYSPPDFFVHGILQARIWKWVAILFSRGSSQPRDQTWVSCTAGRFFTI